VPDVARQRGAATSVSIAGMKQDSAARVTALTAAGAARQSPGT
jgi:hypothetical protein